MATVDEVIQRWLEHNLGDTPWDCANGSKLNGTPRISFHGPLIFTYKQPLAAIMRPPFMDKTLVLIWGSDTTATSDKHRRSVWWVLNQWGQPKWDYKLGDWMVREAERRARIESMFETFNMTASPAHPALNKFNTYAAPAECTRAAVEHFHAQNIRAYEEVEEHWFTKLLRARKQHTRMDYMRNHARMQLDTERYRAYAAQDLKIYTH